MGDVIGMILGIVKLDVIIGAIVAIGVAIWIESRRRPRLQLRIETPPDGHTFPIGAPAANGRFARILLFNKPLWWMVREAAIQCHATVRFRHLNGQEVPGGTMEGRWAGSPEPVAPSLVDNDGQQIGSLVDFALMTRASRIDVHPGDTEALDIAARFDNDLECYGWNNEAYFSYPRWRNPRRRLARGSYLVDVTVRSSGRTRSGHYVLMNDGPRTSFRLEPAKPPFLTAPTRQPANAGGGIVFRPRCYPPASDPPPVRLPNTPAPR
jgi:hypothetical protein